MTGGLHSGFGVLGPVEAYCSGKQFDIGPARQRCVLGVLLVEANRPVPAEQLAARVWGEHPPLRASATLRSYISRLRSALDGQHGAVIERAPAGYLVRTEDDAVDVHLFRRLAALDRREDDDEQADRLHRALELWRGQPFLGSDSAWLTDLRRQLEVEHHAARLEFHDVQLRRGRHAELVAPLRGLRDAHPLDERLVCQLMVALYRDGRQAEALAVYDDLRVGLAEELGVDPEPGTAALHGSLLRAELTAPPPAQPALPRHAVAVREQPTPRQLPAAEHHLCGRDAELSTLDRLFADDRHCVTIVGAGGVGKTTLALAWAHSALDRYPDGQLHLDMRGFGAEAQTTQPVDTRDAVRDILGALGVESAELPVGQAARLGLYRTILAERRVLLLFDNVRHSEQVAELLPGGTTSGVLVTSRHELPALAARHGAAVLRLDVLDGAASGQLLAHRAGAVRLSADPVATRALLRACAGLPLALTIIGARVVSRPDRPLGDLVAELNDTALAPLRAFDAGEPNVNLSTVLSWSEDALPAGDARFFALLSLAPITGVRREAAASLCGVTVQQADQSLQELCAAHLLQPFAERYLMHDLVRDYARGRAEAMFSARDREAALYRFVAWCVRVSDDHDWALQPNRQPVTGETRAPRSGTPSFADVCSAMRLLRGEYQGLLAAQRQALNHGWYREVWGLAFAMNTFQYREGHRDEHIAVWQRGLCAAERLGDDERIAVAHRLLGHAYSRAECITEAFAHLRIALEMAERRDDVAAISRVRHNLALVHEYSGDLAGALAQSEQQLALQERVGNPLLRARALNAVAWYAARTGDHRRGLRDGRAAVALFVEHGYPDGEANALDTLAYLASAAGDHRQALQQYHRVLDVRRTLGDRFQQALTLQELARTHVALDETGAAMDCLALAEREYRSVGNQAAADRAHRAMEDLSREASGSAAELGDDVTVRGQHA